MSALTTLVLTLNIGTVKIELLPEIAPKHVEQIQSLVESKAYDGVVFHRVIEGFMAQTGDVQYGLHTNLSPKVGQGGSNLPDLKAEFNPTPHVRGTVSMARAADPNSANSQFFICFEDARFLDRQYTVFGRVIEGMDVVDQIKRGSGPSGSVVDPDFIKKATLE